MRMFGHGITGRILVVFFLAVFMVVPVCLFSQEDEDCECLGVITVYGRATVSVRPDVVYFPMDISTTAPIIDDAYEENSIKVENTIKKLKKHGIKKEWIKVMDPELFKIEPYSVGEAVIFGVSNVMLVTIPNIDKMKKDDLREKIFEIAQAVSRTTMTPYASTSSPGAGRINAELSSMIGYYGHYPIAVFGYTKYEGLEDKILKDAIDDAREEAEKQAEFLGVELKGISNFYQTYPYNAGCGTGYESTIIPAGPVSSDPNSITLCTSVNVVYRFAE
jgi:uncharacterized protein YggE